MAKYSGSFPPKIKSHSTLYVVANRTEAVFYEEDLKTPFHFIRRVSNPRGRKSEIELVSDRQGRVASSSAGPKLRHGLEPKMTKHEQNAIRFAGRIGREIESIRSTTQIEGIILVAEPHFLGLLREELGPKTTRILRAEIPREYAEGSDRAIQTKIQKALGKPKGPKLKVNLGPSKKHGGLHRSGETVQ